MWSTRSGGVVVTLYRAISSTRNRRNRLISTQAAKTLLGFSSSHRPTMRELRAAYFEAAKQTHPDVAQENEDGIDFVKITKAYERLLDSREIENDATWKISKNEEDEYRSACKAILGIPAEIVEESKQNPMFRHWLGGNTDGAQHWRAFFAVHGGLAQKLQTPAAYLESGQEAATFESRPRRKRR